jgi:hypothetical protein
VLLLVFYLPPGVLASTATASGTAVTTSTSAAPERRLQQMSQRVHVAQLAVLDAE